MLSYAISTRGSTVVEVFAHRCLIDVGGASSSAVSV